MTDILIPTGSIPQTLLRAFPTQIAQISLSELTGRLVPYDVVADVADETPDGLDIYREGFRRGAFERQLSDNGNAKRVGFIHSHRGGLGYLGSFIALRDGPDGLYGDMKILPSKAADVASMIEAGIDELSVEFRLRKSVQNTRVEGGVRWRTSVHLDNVALEAKGAYSGARVLAMRDELDEVVQQQAEEQAHERAEVEQAAAAAEAEAKAAADRAAEAESAKERKARWDELTARTSAEEARSADYRRRFGVS